MKNKQTETKFKSAVRLACHLISRVVCLGAVILICSSAPAQNLFMSDGYSGLAHNLGNIYKITPHGAPRSFASGLDGPLGLAFDSAGNLFVASGGGNVYKFTPAGARSTFASGLDGPEGLAFDSAGNLFVSDNGNIYKFTPEGVRSTFASGLNDAVGLAFDSAGNLFVADILAGNIYKFTPQGVRSTFASGLSYPFDLAFDSAGNLFVVDENTGNIFKFTRKGVRSTFAKEVGLSLDEVAFLAFQPTRPSTPTLVGNISTRMDIGTGDNVLIGGFIITGPSGSTKKVAIRGLGPSLNVNGVPVPGRIADTLIELHTPNGSVVANDNWRNTPNLDELPSSLLPADDRESVIVTTLPPGGYSVIVKGAHGETGVGLVEAYDLDQTSPAKLANISTRGFVQTADNVMIGGFIITGPSGSTKKVALRGLGPSLNVNGVPVPGRLTDPLIELHTPNGSVVTNDNWRDAPNLAELPSSLLPNDDRESVIVTTLPPGGYSVIVKGAHGETGVGLVEAYDLSN